MVRESWVPGSWDTSVVRVAVRVAVWGGQLQVEPVLSCRNGLLKRIGMTELGDQLVSASKQQRRFGVPIDLLPGCNNRE